MIQRRAMLVSGMALTFALALPRRAAAEAPMLTGQDDAGFQAALKQWLDGDEAGALPALSALASAGNAAAQVLLGLIDTTPRFQGPWADQLSRADRLALLRAPGGLSGRNWLQAAAQTEPLARAWLALWGGDADASVVLDLARLGEVHAAHLAAKRLVRREKRGFGALGGDPDFPVFAQALAIRDWQLSDPARASAALAALPPSDPGRVFLGPYRPVAAELLQQATRNPALGLLAAHVAPACPAGDPAAQVALVSQRLGGWWGLAELGPPAAVLIPPAAWAASAQGARSFARLLAETDPAGPAAAAEDACLAALLAPAALP